MNKRRLRIYKKIEKAFEACIWRCRFLIIAPVIFSLLSSFRLITIGTADIWRGLTFKLDFQDPEGKSTVTIVSYIIGGIDYYLIGIVLLIFAFGIYELFISEIEIRHKDESNILQSETLGELKSKLVNVIVVALIVSLFKKMLNLEIQKISDVLYIATAILLISLSQYLLYLGNAKIPKYSKNTTKVEKIIEKI